MPVSRCGTWSSSTSRPTPPRAPISQVEQVRPGGAHVLNADDRAGLHRFEAGLEQQLLHEGIAHLHVGPLLLGAFGELFAGHGGAVDAVAAGLGADVDHRIADAGGLGVEDLVLADQAEREGVDQRIAGVAGLEARLAAQVGHAEAVAVAGDAADDAFDDLMVLADERGIGFAVLGRRAGRSAASP